MSGNSHQRRVIDTAIASGLKRRGESVSPSPGENSPFKLLGRSSIEAYGFFIVAGSYVVMSAFGISVNFLAGLGMSFFIALAAIHLLWSSVWTYNWSRLAKLGSSAIVAIVLLLVANQGYVHTHKIQNPNADTLSALQNLAALIKGLTPASTHELHQTTVIISPDGRYPDIELSEPKEIIQADGHAIPTINQINVGNATARDVMSTGGLFIAPLGREHEDLIFRGLYAHESDPLSQIAYTDIAPKDGTVIPVGGPPRGEDFFSANDLLRMSLYAQTNVLYIAVLVSYQDSHGHIFHKESCWFVRNSKESNMRCSGHNGHG